MLCMVVVFCVNAYQLRSLSGFWQMELQHVNFEAFIVIRLNKMDGCCYDGYIVWFVFRKSKRCDHFYLACWVSRQYIKYMVLACCLLYVTVMMVMNSPKERPKKSRQSFRSISLIQSAFFFKISEKINFIRLSKRLKQGNRFKINDRFIGCEKFELFYNKIIPTSLSKSPISISFHSVCERQAE